MVKRNNYFKTKQEWHNLFSVPRIYQILQSQLISPERRKFDLIALKVAFERDIYFMAELILDRSRITKELIQILLQENQKKMLVQLISKKPRAVFVDLDQYHA